MNRVKNLKSYLLFISFVGVLTLCSSFQSQYDTNSKIKALFIYNFSKYIEWPDDYKSGDFIVGIVGETPLTKELEMMSKTKKVFNQAIVIQKYNSTSDIKKCHMLLVPFKEDAKVSECIQKTNQFSTLVVTEKDGLAKQSGINFVVIQNKQKFQLNKLNIEKRNLKVSSSLLSLAIVVN